MPPIGGLNGLDNDDDEDDKELESELSPVPQAATVDIHASVVSRAASLRARGSMGRSPSLVVRFLACVG
jgi:hypothetical protein